MSTVSSHLGETDRAALERISKATGVSVSKLAKYAIRQFISEYDSGVRWSVPRAGGGHGETWPTCEQAGNYAESLGVRRDAAVRVTVDQDTPRS